VVDFAQAPSTERILLSALGLFSSRGYEATSVREICEAAGVTKPTLYHFYRSKEGVYRALVEGAFEEFHQTLGRLLEEPGTAQERLRRVARSYFEYARCRRELMRFFLSLAYNPSTSAPHTDFVRLYEGIVARIAACAEEAVASGEFEPGSTGVRMLVFMGALGECVCGSLIAGHPALTSDLADDIVDSIVEGWK
jgi:AcrR family transcriptional regulator